MNLSVSKRMDLVERNISAFSMSVDDFTLYNSSEQTDRQTACLGVVRIVGSGALYVKQGIGKGVKLTINFNKTNNCRVFIGAGLKGVVTVEFKNNDSVVYIGNNCNFKELKIISHQLYDFVAVGNKVSCGTNCYLLSGNGAGTSKPYIVLGDDCMLSMNVTIRNTDAHPIFNYETGKQVNMPETGVVVEPHVWIGQNVSILKSVTIGACSVIGLGSIVTKSMDRFSMIKGIPAKGSVQKDLFWSRSRSAPAVKLARYYHDKYLALEGLLEAVN